MVLLHIISNSRDQATEIADLLVRQNLVLNAVTLQEVSVKEKEEKDQVNTSSQVLIIARTRGTLFTAVEASLKDAFPGNEPVMYSIPIVNMSWKEADSLVALEAALQ